MRDSKSYQKMAKNFNKTKKATWSKILLGLRSVQINEIHSALKDKMLAGEQSYKSSQMYSFKCMVLNAGKFKQERRVRCKKSCTGTCSLTKFLYLCMREAKLLDNIELMLYPKVTDHIVKILALKYVKYLNTYCSQMRSE